MTIQYPLLPQELAILCLLILRGPLTAGEINSNSGRLYDFETLDEVQELLNKLSEGEHPFVKQLSKRPGQKEVRFIHLLGEFNEEDFEDSTIVSSGESSTKIKELEDRIVRVHAREGRTVARGLDRAGDADVDHAWAALLGDA